MISLDRCSKNCLPTPCLEFGNSFPSEFIKVCAGKMFSEALQLKDVICLAKPRPLEPGNNKQGGIGPVRGEIGNALLRMLWGIGEAPLPCVSLLSMAARIADLSVRRAVCKVLNGNGMSLIARSFEQIGMSFPVSSARLASAATHFELTEAFVQITITVLARSVAHDFLERTCRRELDLHPTMWRAREPQGPVPGSARYKRLFLNMI